MLTEDALISHQLWVGGVPRAVRDLPHAHGHRRPHHPSQLAPPPQRQAGQLLAAPLLKLVEIGIRDGAWKLVFIWEKKQSISPVKSIVEGLSHIFLPQM